MTRIETAPVGAGGTRDAVRILAARGLRAFGDGCVSLLVPIYLLQLGFSALEIGAIVTSTLIGTALVTLWAGMVANRYSVRRLLLAAALLMIATGAGFAMTTAFWPLLLIAFVGRPRWRRPPSRVAARRSSRVTASSARSPARSASSQPRSPISPRIGASAASPSCS